MKTSKYFRMSLTSNCNLKCYFCHNEGQEKGNNRAAFMSANDICWIASVAKDLGYTKFKLTGGEPTLHPQIIDIIKGISNLEVEDLSMITNGFKLKKMASELKSAGLNRINVSLYTLDPDKFKAKNGGSEKALLNVIDGIDEAIACGYKNIKLNYIWDGIDNMKDFLNVCEFAAHRDLTVVLLPILRFNEALDAEHISLTELYELLLQTGISSETNIIDGEGMEKKLVQLTSGAKVLIREVELNEKLPYSRCKTCIQKNECREGIFPTRLSANGVLHPCLSEGIQGISIFDAIKTQDTQRVINTFEKIREL